VEVDGQIAVFVALKDFSVPAAPVDILMEQIVKCVADILPRFDPLF
jgi:hypothetical protein